ncbi:MAG: hypothetical protein RLZZ524_354 [Pseudomonadota bacterium]
MTSAAASELLQLIGKDITRQGIVVADDLPAAIRALERAIGHDDALRKQDAVSRHRSLKGLETGTDSGPTSGSDSGHDPGPDTVPVTGSDDALDATHRASASGSDDEPVSLRRRAWPLLDQLRQSSRHRVPVVWDTRTLPSAVPLRAAGYV